MTIQTLTLTDFLLARIAEDEAVAQAAASDPLGSIEAGIKADALKAEEDGDAEGPTLLWAAARIADAVARLRPRTLHDPARVLAECEARRRIVAVMRAFESAIGAQSSERTIGTLNGLRIAVKELALPYVDHPDYRSEWKP